MGKVKQIQIKNRTYYFYNDMINIEEFDSNLMDKKSYKDIDTYYIGYIAIKKLDDCENIYSLNPLYLIIDKVDGHTEWNYVEEKNGTKYLVFGSTDENKEILKQYTNFGMGLKMKLMVVAINGGKKKWIC